jgi:hypothetical protein
VHTPQFFTLVCAMLKVVAFGWAWEESYETDSNLHKYTVTPLTRKDSLKQHMLIHTRETIDTSDSHL